MTYAPNVHCNIIAQQLKTGNKLHVIKRYWMLGLVHWHNPAGWYGGVRRAGFRMGNMCTPVAEPCWCMAKPTQYCEVMSLQLTTFIFKKREITGQANYRKSVITFIFFNCIPIVIVFSIKSLKTWYITILLTCKKYPQCTEFKKKQGRKQHVGLVHIKLRKTESISKIVCLWYYKGNLELLS